MRSSASPLLLSCMVLCVSAVATSAQQHEQLPPPRPIPGLTADDPFPGTCVDCHVADPGRDLDERFATLFRRWNEAPDSAFLARLQPFAPDGVILTGAHPTAASALDDIPASCSLCHSPTSPMAPPLAPMVHTLHLTGGAANVFLTQFQGECTYCHKFDAARGAWSIPSGPER